MGLTKNNREYELLRMCLTALNTAERFPIPALGIDSYQLASLLDAYFKPFPKKKGE